MNFKISEKDKNLLLIVGGLLIFILVYTQVFLNLQEKTDSIEQETLVIESNIRTLEGIRAEEEFYKQDIIDLTEENTEIKNSYPSNILTADKIIYVKDVELVYDMAVSYLAINEPVSLDTAYPVLNYMDANGNEGSVVPENPNNIYMYDHNFSITFDTGYEDIKSAVQYILNDKNQKAIHDLVLSYNSTTGTLSGTMQASMYQLTGTGIAYSRPNFIGIKTGTDDLFKTMEIESLEETPSED